MRARCACFVVGLAMFETPTPPSEKGPSQEWAVTYVKSICGILKIVEVVLKPIQSKFG